ncbi:MAG: PH domain-containing protein [Candidatus Bathyarchaeota archaeon]|jgi:membrane protein YdbS with pleckstrin-like domain
MRDKVGIKVIKPPIKKVTSGKIFTPSKEFLYKEWTKILGIAATIWILVAIGFFGISYIVAKTDPSELPDYDAHVNRWLPPVVYWTSIINAIWVIPALLAIPFYIRSIEYSVKSETGETMPEIYVKKGIFTITRKHVPFRTITNITSNAGIFDRLFGVGNVSIETAGYSGSSQTGPEEKLEGIVFYEEVRDFILNELRKFRAPYVSENGLGYSEDKRVPEVEGLDDEILVTLREIRNLLRDMRDRTVEN